MGELLTAAARAACVLAALATGIVASAGAAGAQVGGGGCAAGEERIRLSHGYPSLGHPIGAALEAFAADINAAFDGRYCIHVYADGALLTDGDSVQALLRGDVEMIASPTPAFEPLTRAFRIFDLPFLFEDSDAAKWFQNSGPGTRLRRALDGSGVRGLIFLNGGMRQLSASGPVLSPTDLEGLSFAAAASVVARAQFDALRAASRPTTPGEARVALTAGDLDGFEGVLSDYVGARLYELQDGVTITNHAIATALVAVSEPYWDGLPRDLRRAMTSALARVAVAAHGQAQAAAEIARAELIDLGVEVRDLTPEQRAEWVAAARQVWRLFEADVGAALIQAAVNANL